MDTRFSGEEPAFQTEVRQALPDDTVFTGRRAGRLGSREPGIFKTRKRTRFGPMADAFAAS